MNNTSSSTSEAEPKHSEQPDIDICKECGEHAEFDESGSNCCGASPYDSDPDIDMER